MGLFQQADGGTLFLDEIGETSPAFQVKLLRALQEGVIRPLGDTRSVAVNVRVIAATNRKLEADVASGRFREDLYYRLAGITLYLPALRERTQDIALIIADVLKNAPLVGRKFTPEALNLLCQHSWPGNVRELQNEIHRALALADGLTLGPELLSPRVRQGPALQELTASAPVESDASGFLKNHLDHVEAQFIRAAMVRHQGNKTRVAEELGLTRVGLRMKLARLGLG